MSKPAHGSTAEGAMATMTRRTKQASTYRTIGAISGHFPSAAQRALNTKLAEMSVGAQQARDTDAVEMTSTAAYLGVCPVCDSHRYGKAEDECGQCANYRARGLLVGDTWVTQEEE